MSVNEKNKILEEDLWKPRKEVFMYKDYRKAILVVSSGTTNEKARKENIEAVEERIQNEFPGFQVRRAFTSSKIISRLREQGINIDAVNEALERLIQEGIDEVVIQPLHIIPGSEYENIISTASKFKNNFKTLLMGTPLLYKSNDYVEVVNVLKLQIQKLKQNEAVVFMGHGSRTASNECYSLLQTYIDREKLNIFVGTIKGEPSIQSITERLKEKSIKRVILRPFMLVAGNHALVDMASDDENSWKSVLQREGFEVNVYLHGLGENEEFQTLYVKRVKEAMAKGGI